MFWYALCEAMRKLCLEVEEELHQAVSQDFSAEAREKLLKRLWVKVHPDKLLDQTGPPGFEHKFLYWIWWICVSWCNLNITVLLHDSGSHFLLLYSWVGSTHEDLVERLRGVHFMKFVWHVQFWSLKSKIPRKRREAFNWFEDWKGIHIIWYYRPHAVPEADRKYLPKDSNWKLNSWVAVCHRPPGGAWRSAEAPLDLSAAKVSRLLLRVTVSTDLEVLQRKNEKWPAGWSTGGSSCCLVSTIPLSWWSLELPAGRWPVCLFRCWSGGAMLTGWWFGTFGLFFIIFPYIIYWE